MSFQESGLGASDEDVEKTCQRCVVQHLLESEVITVQSVSHLLLLVSTAALVSVEFDL